MMYMEQKQEPTVFILPKTQEDLLLEEVEEEAVAAHPVEEEATASNKIDYRNIVYFLITKNYMFITFLYALNS